MVGGPFQVSPCCFLPEVAEVSPAGFGHRVAQPLLTGVVVVGDLDDVVAVGCIVEVLVGPLESLVGCEPFDYFLRVHGGAVSEVGSASSRMTEPQGCPCMVPARMVASRMACAASRAGMTVPPLWMV